MAIGITMLPKVSPSLKVFETDTCLNSSKGGERVMGMMGFRPASTATYGSVARSELGSCHSQGKMHGGTKPALKV